jgi:phosphonate transport system ATP-binding protein
MLLFNTVTKQYQKKNYAIQDITLEISKGQFCVLLGPSGAGKSTLLRLANGLISPTNGTVSFDSIELKNRSAIKKIQPRTAMVHQSFNLTGRLSVLDNVLCGALPKLSTLRALFKLFPTPYQQQACMLLKEVGLEEEFLYRRAMHLSGGQQQRVAIARAFLLNPDLVLADEPVASLDPKISVDILTLLKDSSQRFGATVLCSLHQVEFAKQFADRIIGIKDGKLVFDGLPSELSEEILHSLYSTISDQSAKNITNEKPDDQTVEQHLHALEI